MRNPSLYNHPSPTGKGCMLENWVCRPIKYLRPALSVNLKNHVTNHSSDYANSVDNMNGCTESGALENDENENYFDENDSEAESDEDIAAEKIILIQISSQILIKEK